LRLKRRFDRRWEWEMVFPKPGVAPVTWQTRAMTLPRSVDLLAKAYSYCN